MTRKLLFFFVVMLLGSSITLSAQQHGGGFTGPGAQAVSVQEAKNLRDDAPVILRGTILRFLGDERYLFSDNTGTIVVEIDDKLWIGFSVSENELVEIRGEVDRELLRVEIDVKSIRKL